MITLSDIMRKASPAEVEAFVEKQERRHQEAVAKFAAVSAKKGPLVIRRRPKS